jgi:DNA modification methylase
MYNLIQGDCLQEMDKLIANGVKVDLVLTDPPYGTTACKWDSVIPFEPMWNHLCRILKKGGAVALFGSEPFSSALRMSNIKWYKYDWYWGKKIPSGMSYAKYQPMRQIENISIFSDGKTVYNPQKVKRDKPIKGGGGCQKGKRQTTKTS